MSNSTSRPAVLLLLGLAIAMLISVWNVGLLMTADPVMDRSATAASNDRAPATSPSKTPFVDAIAAVAPALTDNRAGVTRDTLRALPNPRGDGMFVYSEVQQDVSGVKRQFVWMVIDEQAYALNGPSKGVTPLLAWPREAPPQVWERTRLNAYSPSEALSIVFGQ